MQRAAEIPAAPFVAGVLLIVLGALIGRLHARGGLTLPRGAVALALAVYAAGVVANTVFPIFIGGPGPAEPWNPPVALVPFADYELADALKNIGVFIPLGVLFALVLSRPTWWRVLLMSSAASLGIEALQFAVHDLLSGGHIADVNDLLANTSGGVVGFALMRAASRIPRLGRAIDRFRWTPTTPG